MAICGTKAREDKMEEQLKFKLLQEEITQIEREMKKNENEKDDENEKQEIKKSRRGTTGENNVQIINDYESGISHNNSSPQVNISLCKSDVSSKRDITEQRPSRSESTPPPLKPFQKL